MTESNALYFQLAVVLGLAAGVGFFVRFLKLPLLVAYLLAGVILSFAQIFDLHTSQALTFLPEIGIAFVLFFVGMELDLKEIRFLGKAVAIASLGQIVISLIAGFIIAQFLGFPETESIFLGIGLAFSSTIVVVKMLLEKKDLNSLYGKLSVGILLIEDLVAIVLLMMMTVGSSVLNLGLQNSLPILTLLLKGGALLLLALGLSRYVLSKIFTAAAKSAELLFLSAIAWCFIFITISVMLGFSVVIGAFLAGLALANSPFHFEIQGKVKPLRDFFVTLFFIYLGSQVVFEDLSKVAPLIAIFTAYALIVKPIIFLLILGAFGFKKHTIFQTAINLSQISEFSLIVLIVGLKQGIVSQEALTAMALTGVISIISSTILIAFSRQIYNFILPAVAFFESQALTHRTEDRSQEVEMEDHVLLVGAHRMGGEIMKFLKRQKIPFLVLDFNPETVENLMEQKNHVVYGDLGDPEILEFLNLEKSKMVISTASNLDDNLMLLSEMKVRKAKAVAIVRASSAPDAEELYRAGADYVILPAVVSGHFVAHILEAHWPNMEFFKKRASVELEKLAHSHLSFE